MLSVEEIILSLVNSAGTPPLSLSAAAWQVQSGHHTENQCKEVKGENQLMPLYITHLNSLIFIAQNNSTLGCMLFFRICDFQQEA